MRSVPRRFAAGNQVVSMLTSGAAARVGEEALHGGGVRLQVAGRYATGDEQRFELADAGARSSELRQRRAAAAAAAA